MKILHTADLHIGAELSYLDLNREARRYEVLAVFKRITEICKSEGVEVCLIAGDLFDSNSAAKAFFGPVRDYISDAKDTKFLYVAGNHDPLDASSPFLNERLPENLTVFGTEYETVIFEDLKLRVTGRSFSHSQMQYKSTEPMPEDEYINIMLMHCDFAAAGSIYNPITAENVMSSGADYFALGHIHKRTAVEKVSKTFTSYPGCPEGQGFDETGVKGVYMGEISKGKADLKFVPCSARLHIVKKIDLSFADSTDSALGSILTVLESDHGENYGKNLYKLILTGYPEDLSAVDCSMLSALLKDKLYFVKLQNTMHRRIDPEILSKEVSLRGVFVRKMLERAKDADEKRKQKIFEAMYLGLDAFETEVYYDEDIIS